MTWWPLGGYRRPVASVASVVGFLGLVGVAYALAPTRVARPPAYVARLGAGAAEVRVSGRVRFVMNRDAPATLLPDSAPPRRGHGARLLFYEGRAAQPAGREVLVVDSAGQLLRFDPTLRVERLGLDLGSRRIVSAVQGVTGGLWAVDAGGQVLRLDEEGGVLEEQTTPFAYPSLAGDPASDAAWVVRSPRQFDFGFAPGPSPIAVRVDSAAATSGRSVGNAIEPEHALLRTLANAGHLVVAGDTLFFAPFIRDEIVAFGPAGDTLWVATRGLPQSTVEPRFEIADKRPVIDYHPVNLGLTRGLDGHLYVLSTPGFTMSASRLDVFAVETGLLLRSVALATPTPTLAADAEGRVFALDPVRLLGGTPAAERPLAPEVELPLLDGGRVALRDLRGQVVLVNLWASWCSPCRREMPALDQLRRRIADTGFVFLAINEDHDAGDARRFIDEFGFRFPVPLGGGKLERVFYYPGLPYTVLLDSHGRVAQTWIGEITPTELGLLEAAIRRELNAGVVPPSHEGHAGH